jgi:hypothetical protein
MHASKPSVARAILTDVHFLVPVAVLLVGMCLLAAVR